MKPIRIALLIAALAVPVAACAAFVTTLPKVIQAVDVTTEILDAIDTFAHDLFKVKPDADLEKKVVVGMAYARKALDAGKHTLDGVDRITKAQLDEAFADFRVAYQDLVALLGPYGLNATSGEVKARGASGGGLSVPPASELPLKG